MLVVGEALESGCPPAWIWLACAYLGSLSVLPGALRLRLNVSRKYEAWSTRRHTCSACTFPHEKLRSATPSTLTLGSSARALQHQRILAAKGHPQTNP